MFSFLKRELPAVGRVLYPGSIPPGVESLRLPEGATVSRLNPAADQIWAVRATHPDWGTAEIAAGRGSRAVPDVLIDHTLSLSPEEKQQARRGEASIAVRVAAAHKHVLRDRKRLLRWLHTLMQPYGVVAVDGSSMLMWSDAMLRDELAHDADIDIESLYVIHAVGDVDQRQASWLHTHGLEELGAFDVDILTPSRSLVGNCGDPLRALAFAALEGQIAPDTERFPIAFPGGDIRLVPVDRFQREAADEHRCLRDPDEPHSGRRAVVCEPAGGFLARWRQQRPAPSKFMATLTDQGFVIPFSTAATELMAERARRTLDVFSRLREEFARLQLPSVVKLGYEVDGGGAENREHLWFEVHGIAGGRIDATLANAPHNVSHLRQGQRGMHDVERLTDWLILSPEGQMTPRNLGAARKLRVTREEWQARLDAQPALS